MPRVQTSSPTHSNGKELTCNCGNPLYVRGMCGRCYRLDYRRKGLAPEDKRKRSGVCLGELLDAKVQGVANKYKLSRSEAIRMLVQWGLDSTDDKAS